MNNKPDCSQHKKEVAGISDMRQLAEMIGDLHYESLYELTGFIADKLYNDGIKDFQGGRTDLSSKLYQAAFHARKLHDYIGYAWQISKPFMKSITNSQSPENKTV